jgi:hypothetical protein
VTKGKSLKAKRMLSHAIRYLGTDTSEQVAVIILQSSLRQAYSEHYSRFTGIRGNGNGHQVGRMVRHWCTDCHRYDTARVFCVACEARNGEECICDDLNFAT